MSHLDLLTTAIAIGICYAAGAFHHRLGFLSPVVPVAAFVSLAFFGGAA